MCDEKMMYTPMPYEICSGRSLDHPHGNMSDEHDHHVAPELMLISMAHAKCVAVAPNIVLKLYQGNRSCDFSASWWTKQPGWAPKMILNFSWYTARETDTACSCVV